MDRENKGLLDVGSATFRELPLTDDLSWLKERVSRLVAGGVYLLAGPPGIGKSTLSIQLALDLGAQDIQSIYILTEQSKQELANRARLMTSTWKPRIRDKAFVNLKPEDAMYDIDTLPTFLAHKVISGNGVYHGTPDRPGLDPRPGVVERGGEKVPLPVRLLSRLQERGNHRRPRRPRHKEQRDLRPQDVGAQRRLHPLHAQGVHLSSTLRAEESLRRGEVPTSAS